MVLTSRRSTDGAIVTLLLDMTIAESIHLRSVWRAAQQQRNEFTKYWSSEDLQVKNYVINERQRVPQMNNCSLGEHIRLLQDGLHQRWLT